MAEKFSKFRDPGTGIQVFLTPVASSGTATSGSTASSGVSLASLLFTPIFVLLGLLRSILAALGWAIYLASGAAIGLRIVLFSLGFIRLPIDVVAKRGDRKSVAAGTVAEVKKGDLVMINHCSWIDVLIVAYLYPSIHFLVPVINEQPSPTQQTSAGGEGRKRTPKKNAMSAHTRIVTPTAPTSASSNEIAVVGYAIVPLTKAMALVGGLPPATQQLSAEIYSDIGSALSSSPAPLALFPEATTSNNRALLNFSLLPSTPPPSLHSTHLLTLKYSAPTSTSVSSVYTTAVASNSKWRHWARIVLLSSPVRGVTLRSTALPAAASGGVEAWGEEVAQAMSTLARLKRTSIGWSAKAEFLQMVASRKRA